MTHDQTLRLAIAAGGTGGHISPAIALLEELHASKIPFDAIWIGSRGPFERQAADDMHIPFHAIRVGKLRRYISPRTILDTARIPVGVAESLRILRKWRPDVVISTGGYVGVPPVIASRYLHIPAITHEQTASLGLATKINARFADVVALSYDASRHPQPRTGQRVVVTGNPVRSSILGGSVDGAYRHFNLVGDRPLMYITGGAQGAQAINRFIESMLPELLEAVEIIHQCGPSEANGDFPRLCEQQSKLPSELAARYHPVERTGEELRHVYAATSVVVGRAGAGTVSELAALGIPAVLIPLPGAEEQRLNAEALARGGATHVIDQDRLDRGEFQRCISELIELRNGRANQARNPDEPDSRAARRLLDEIIELSTKQR